MSEEWLDDGMGQLSDYAFMKTYRTAYWSNPALKAALDQRALGTGYRLRSGGGEAERIAAETARRGLVWPDSWEAAGLEPFK